MDVLHFGPFEKSGKVGLRDAFQKVCSARPFPPVNRASFHPVPPKVESEQKCHAETQRARRFAQQSRNLCSHLTCMWVVDLAGSAGGS